MILSIYILQFWHFLSFLGLAEIQVFLGLILKKNCDNVNVWILENNKKKNNQRISTSCIIPVFMILQLSQKLQRAEERLIVPDKNVIEKKSYLNRFGIMEWAVQILIDHF